MKEFKRLIAILVLAIMAWGFYMVTSTSEPTPQATFDTSALESWCAGAGEGTVRMVGACWYDESSVEDEQGNVWTVQGLGIGEDDFLLLWIADNNTPNDVTDDLIIKVWTEAHE